MILAAGLGSRMGALTQSTPKPLLKIKQHYLIEYAIASVVRAGIKDIVINVSHGAETIQQTLGSGLRYGVAIHYSIEKDRLETGGGIVNALHLLKDDAFFVMSCDIITDYPVKQLLVQPKKLAHVVLVDNPEFHPAGDFGLNANSDIDRAAKPTYTFANLAVYAQDFFSTARQQRIKFASSPFFPLNQLLFPAIEQGQVTGEYYHGLWHNIGTPQDLLRAESDPNLPAIQF